MDNSISLEFSILFHYKLLADNTRELIGLRIATWDENRNDLLYNFRDTDEKMDILILVEELENKNEDEIREMILTELKTYNWVNMTHTELIKQIDTIFQ